MTTIKYSRQREAIKSFLSQRDDHPTAEIVYKNIVKEFPHISLGTVYRNLTFLVEHGQAITVPCNDGSVHFDAKTYPHYHFQCTKCNSISDIEIDDADYEKNIISKAQELANNKTIEGHVTFFYGLCESCSKET